MPAVDVALSPFFGAQYAGCFDEWLDFFSSESIEIYITVGGSSTPLRVMESDSIASVKLRIQACKGFVVKRQKLVYGGRELSRTASLVKDYGIKDGNALHLALRISDLVLINVKTVCGEEIEFQVDRHRNIGYVKRRIANEGNGFQYPEILCHGEKLEDDRLIHDLSNSSDAVINLVVHKYAKVLTEPVERDVKLSVVAPNSNNGTDGNGVQENTLQSKDFFLDPIIVNPRKASSLLVEDGTVCF